MFFERRHGLRRSLYKGPDGIRSWVGLGVIAHNIIHIGTHLAKQASVPRGLAATATTTRLQTQAGMGLGLT